MLNQKDIQVSTSNQFIFCQRPILRWFYPQLLPNTDPKPPTSKYIHILKHTFCSSKYQCLVENILLPDLSIVDAAVCGCHTVAHCTVRWMRCKFNQELGGNLLSKTFLLGSRLRKLGFKCSGSHNSFQTVFTQSFGIQRFLKIDFPFLLWCHCLEVVAVVLSSVQLQISLFWRLLSRQPAFCHLFCSDVYWPGDVIMTSECLQAFLFRSSHCTGIWIMAAKTVLVATS